MNMQAYIYVHMYALYVYAYVFVCGAVYIVAYRQWHIYHINMCLESTF